MIRNLDYPPPSDQEHFNKFDQSLWNLLLDGLLHIENRLETGAEMRCHRHIIETLMTGMVTQTWHKMSAYVPAANIVRQISENHSNAHLGELREILQQVLDMSGNDEVLYKSTKASLKIDLHILLTHRRSMTGNGKRLLTGASSIDQILDVGELKSQSALGHFKVSSETRSTFLRISDAKVQMHIYPWGELRSVQFKPVINSPPPMRFPGSLQTNALYCSSWG